MNNKKKNSFFVSGLINIETTLPIECFPITYYPIDFPFNKINSHISGVGYNICKALNTLDDNKIYVSSILGNDFFSKMIYVDLKENNFNLNYITFKDTKTPQSIVLYEKETGIRQIHCDLKNVQDYMLDNPDIDLVDVAILCNINYNRNLLKFFKSKNILIATDVHILKDINDNYNKDFMENANILFLSDESLPYNYEKFICDLYNTYHNDIIVIGLGNKGACIKVKDNPPKLYNAVNIGKVVNTVGAGDALFSCFIYYYIKTNDPYLSLERAVYFAGIKILSDGAASGFIDFLELEKYF